MIRRFLASCCLVFLPLTLTHAARLWRLGLEGGLEVNHMKASKELIRADNRSGWFAGPKFKVQFKGSGFGLDVAALYHYNKIDYQDALPLYPTADAAGSSAVHRLVAPVNLRYTFRLAKVLGLYVATGPQANWTAHADDLADFIDLKDYYFNWNFGGGVELFNRLQLGFTYQLPLQDLGHVRSLLSDTALKEEHRWNVRLAVYF